MLDVPSFGPLRSINDHYGVHLFNPVSGYKNMYHFVRVFGASIMHVGYRRRLYSAA